MFGNKALKHFFAMAGLVVTASQGMDTFNSDDYMDPSGEGNPVEFSVFSLEQHTPNSKRGREEEIEVPGAPKKKQKKENEDAPEVEGQRNNVRRRLFAADDDAEINHNDVASFLMTAINSDYDNADQENDIVNDQSVFLFSTQGYLSGDEEGSDEHGGFYFDFDDEDFDPKNDPAPAA